MVPIPSAATKTLSAAPLPESVKLARWLIDERIERSFLRLSLPCLLTTLLWTACVGANAQTATQQTIDPPEINVTMSRSKGYPLFDVTAKMTVNAGVMRSWTVLTDYDGLAGFVPNLSRSQVTSRNGNERVVAQSGFAKFLFIRQPVDLILHVTEQPMQTIDIRLISGNMREYQARWELQALPPRQAPDGDRTQIAYAGLIAPDFYVPTLFGAALMKSDLRNMLNAVKAEIEKRP
jgi:ribosome-associated toxin RatA of RatAB toxin-antitoxin module